MSELWRKLTFSAFPNREETQAAADAGDQEAIKELPTFDSAVVGWRRVIETRGSDVAAPAELDHGDVRCVLDVVQDEGETWLTLTANGLEVHREWPPGRTPSQPIGCSHCCGSGTANVFARSISARPSRIS